MFDLQVFPIEPLADLTSIVIPERHRTDRKILRFSGAENHMRNDIVLCIVVVKRSVGQNGNASRVCLRRNALSPIGETPQVTLATSSPAKARNAIPTMTAGLGEC